MKIDPVAPARLAIVVFVLGAMATAAIAASPLDAGAGLAAGGGGQHAAAMALDIDTVRDWWGSLPMLTRRRIAVDMMILGDFSGVADGTFTDEIFAAIERYRTHANMVDLSVPISARGLVDLRKAASDQLSVLSITSAVDPASGLPIIVPFASASEAGPAPSDGTVFYALYMALDVVVTQTDYTDASFTAARARLTSQSDTPILSRHENDTLLFVERAGEGEGTIDLLWRGDAKMLSMHFTFAPKDAQAGRLIAGLNAAVLIDPDIAWRFDLFRRSPTTSDTLTIARVMHGPFDIWDVDPTTMYLRGNIEATAAVDFNRALLASPKAKRLVLNSDGGIVDAALVIARKAHELGLDTFVPIGARCYSACAYIFFAGATRQVDGTLGVHQISGERLTATGAQDTMADILDLLEDYGVPHSIRSAMLHTHPESMYELTPADLTLVTTPEPDEGNDAALFGMTTPVTAAMGAITLCQWALDFHRWNWNASSDRASYVAEAKLRGYSADDCRKMASGKK